MAGSIQRYFAGLSRNTFLLAATSLFADISTEMLYPVLPDLPLEGQGYRS